MNNKPPKEGIPYGYYCGNCPHLETVKINGSKWYCYCGVVWDDTNPYTYDLLAQNECGDPIKCDKCIEKTLNQLRKRS